MNAANHGERQATETHAASAYVSWGWVESPDAIASDIASAIPSTQLPAQSLKQSPIQSPNSSQIDLFKPVRNWLDRVAVDDIKFAHFLCKSIPSQCPFERDIKLLGRTILHIPPLCKLNPVYDEVVALRFRALCYLADRCGEDISSYC